MKGRREESGRRDANGRLEDGAGVRYTVHTLNERVHVVVLILETSLQCSTYVLRIERGTSSTSSLPVWEQGRFRAEGRELSGLGKKGLA